MADQTESQPAPQASNLNDLPPWKINPDSYADKETKDAAMKRIQTWLGELEKDISDLLTKNGVTTYQISGVHNGTKTPFLLVEGNNYACAKLAALATAQLKTRIATEIDKISG